MADHAAHGRAGLTVGRPAADRPAADTAPDAEAERLEAGRLLFARECLFLRGVPDLAHLPEAGLPEVAFAGRSNVGKSSLINALTGRTTLARTSNTPGRTQALNFFELGSRLVLVDMPGYGYAEAPKPLVAAWHRLIDAYLRGRAPLRRASILVDARRGLGDLDTELMARLRAAAVVYQIVVTKADLVKPKDLDARLDAIRAATVRDPAAFPEVFVTSSRKADGIPRLRAALAALAAPSPA